VLYELIELPGKARKSRRKKRKDPTSVSRLQLALPHEPFVGGTEQDIIEDTETVDWAKTTKTNDWRSLDAIGGCLRSAFADSQPTRYGCKNLL